MNGNKTANHFPVGSLAEDSTVFEATIFNYGRRPLPGEAMLREVTTSVLRLFSSACVTER
ncbi:hypothetical protein LVD17_21065 [Fulvivirga ulvae]|uniref:hypothetical protein n=1 Tax=Fulvivirga ulvae TaxID=2904245 RepID=UPI001F3049F9|nr:hypothetical protein [Fulvivirga ulvae]UII30788.1 hypothetical protein LVD17_21065 [Fulvivirga ulvae]